MHVMVISPTETDLVGIPETEALTIQKVLAALGYTVRLYESGPTDTFILAILFADALDPLDFLQEIERVAQQKTLVPLGFHLLMPRRTAAEAAAHSGRGRGAQRQR